MYRTVGTIYSFFKTSIFFTNHYTQVKHLFAFYALSKTVETVVSRALTALPSFIERHLSNEFIYPWRSEQSHGRDVIILILTFVKYMSTLYLNYMVGFQASGRRNKKKKCIFLKWTLRKKAKCWEKAAPLGLYCILLNRHFFAHSSKSYSVLTFIINFLVSNSVVAPKTEEYGIDLVLSLMPWDDICYV